MLFYLKSKKATLKNDLVRRPFDIGAEGGGMLKRWKRRSRTKTMKLSSKDAKENLSKF